MSEIEPFDGYTTATNALRSFMKDRHEWADDLKRLIEDLLHRDKVARGVVRELDLKKAQAILDKLVLAEVGVRTAVAEVNRYAPKCGKPSLRLSA